MTTTPTTTTSTTTTASSTTIISRLLHNITTTLQTTLHENIKNNKNDGSDHPTEHIESMDTRDLILISCFVAIFIIGIAGNLLVCYVFLWRNTKNALTTMELLIVFLAVADLVASIFNPFMFIYWTITFHKAWHFGKIGCKILPSMTRITTTLSFGIILIITVDRCVVICFPFRRNMKRTEVFMSVFAALIFAITSELCYTIYIRVNPESTCQVPDTSIPGFLYPNLIFSITRDLAFLIIFSVTVSLIYMTLYNRDVVATLREQRVVKKTQKIIQMLIIMALVFILLIYPRDILHIAFNISWQFPPGIPYTKAFLDVNSFLKVLHMCNSICNVFIYARLHGKFRRRVFQMLRQLLGIQSNSGTSDEENTEIYDCDTFLALTLEQHHKSDKKQHPTKLFQRRFSITRMTRERQRRILEQVFADAEIRLMFSKETDL